MWTADVDRQKSNAGDWSADDESLMMRIASEPRKGVLACLYV